MVVNYKLINFLYNSLKLLIKEILFTSLWTILFHDKFIWLKK